MKLALIIISFLNGGYMLADGIYVLLHGKYIGPDKPGPWSDLLLRLNMEIFKLGPLFIVFGLAWMGLLAGVWLNKSWAFTAGICISILTLWYLPWGTLLSIAVLLILIMGKSKLGM